MPNRLSTYQIFSRPAQDIIRMSAQVSRTQEQISSGKRVLTPADDPVASARILQLEQDIALTQQYEKNINLVDSRLEQEEGVLQAVEASIQRIRELTVRAGDGSLSFEDRIAISYEIEERLKEMLDLLNTKDAGGEYLFSGFAGATQPFVQAPGGGYRYQGDEGQRELQISRTIQIASSDSGKRLFMQVPAVETSFYTYAGDSNTGTPTGTISQGLTLDQDALNAFAPDSAVISFNDSYSIDPPGANLTVRRQSDGRPIEGLESVRYQPGVELQFAGMNVSISGNPAPGDRFFVKTSAQQGVLNTLEKLQYGLQNYADDPQYAEPYKQMLSHTLDNLDNAIETISLVRARIGGRLNVTQTTRDMHQDSLLAAKGIQANLRDLDFAEAISRLEMQSFVLQASQQSFARITDLSLFDYLR